MLQGVVCGTAAGRLTHRSCISLPCLPCIKVCTGSWVFVVVVAGVCGWQLKNCSRVRVVTITVIKKSVKNVQYVVGSAMCCLHRTKNSFRRIREATENALKF